MAYGLNASSCDPLSTFEPETFKKVIPTRQVTYAETNKHHKYTYVILSPLG